MDMREIRRIGAKLRICQPPKDEPTQREIAERTAAIQAEWSESEERKRRAVERPVDMTVVHRVVDDGER